jgi:hypothetical protein
MRGAVGSAARAEVAVAVEGGALEEEVAEPVPLATATAALGVGETVVGAEGSAVDIVEESKEPMMG